MIDMNALELLVLGRVLMKIASEAMPLASPEQAPASVRSILIDVSEHPDTSIGEITARTGFPQSHVSLAIARLKEGRVVVTAVDPRDRRRTLVRACTVTSSGVANPFVLPAPIDAALAGALGTDDPLEIAAAIAALESVAKRLNPRGITHTRSERRLQAGGETR
jgi:hypothetical protein